MSNHGRIGDKVFAQMHSQGALQLHPGGEWLTGLQFVMSLFFILIATSITTTTTTTSLVVFRHNWCTDAFDFFVLLLNFFSISFGVAVEPRLAVLQSIHYLLFFVFIEFLRQALVLTRAFCCRTHGVQVAIESILCIYAFLNLLIFVCELFSFLDHLFDLLFSEAALVVGDGDFLTLASALVFSSYIQDAVRIDFESYFDLWLATRSRGDTTKFEFAKQMIILGHRTFALEDHDVDCGLIILVSGEDLRLLGWNYSVPADQLCHHTTNGLNTKRQGRDVQKQEVLATFSTQDASLHSSAVGNGFIRVNATIWLLTVEKILD